MVPQTNIDTRTYRNELGPDTGPYRNEFDTDTWLYRNGISTATGPSTGGFRSATWLDQGGFGAETWPYQNGFSLEAPTRHNGGGRSGRPGSGSGSGSGSARHRKPPSRRMRRAATASAIVIGGGAAAVGLLYATGPQPALNTNAGANAKSVTSAPRAGNADGAATGVAAVPPSASASASAPASALAPVGSSAPTTYMPRHAAASGRHAAPTAPTATGAPTRHGPPTASHSVPGPSPSSPSASAPGSSPAPSSSAPASTPASTPATLAPTPPAATAPPSTAAGLGACTDPTFTTSSDFGSENLGPYTVSNNMWNAGGGGITQTLSACSAGDWFVTADVAEDGGGVKTYPNSRYNFADPPEISSLGSVTSTFGSTSPDNGDFEDAYDIWLNGAAGAGGDEVMIWTDNHGETPAGSPVATATFDGQSYTVWQDANGPVTFVSDANASAGDLNLLQFFQWLTSNGYEPANSQLYQVDYGVEIATTNGAQETFGFNNFSVSSS
jgi:Glycosyl hydrolase family 12